MEPEKFPKTKKILAEMREALVNGEYDNKTPVKATMYFECQACGKAYDQPSSYKYGPTCRTNYR